MSEVRGLKYKDVRDGVLTVRRTILTVDGGAYHPRAEQDL